jgi:thiosulfate/3-mercaptopyruvate sulfurtransferase
MTSKVLVSPGELSDMMSTEPVAIIDTRDPAIYAEAHIPARKRRSSMSNP